MAARDVTELSLEQLMQVSVLGASKYEQKQSDVAAAVSVITRQEIKAFGWRTLDVALASLPGIYTTYDRQYAYVGMRGFSVPGDFNTRVLLTIDGNRVNDAVYDQAYIGRDFPLDMDLVERIEFIPGPGGAVYGQNAMFGVINIVTRDGSSVNGVETVTSYQRPQDTSEIRGSWGEKFANDVDVLLSASGMRSRGVDRFMTFGASGISGVAAHLDGEGDTELFARAGRGAWTFEYVQGNRRKDDPTGVYLSDPLIPGTYQRDRIRLSQLQYQNSLAGGTLQFSGRLFAGEERYTAPETFGGDVTESGAASNWRGAELRVLTTALRAHKLMMGIEYQDNWRQDQLFDDFTTTPRILDTYIPRHGWRLGLYAQDEWSLSPTLSATIGVRSDRNNEVDNALSPRLGLIWNDRSSTTMKVLYGRAFRAPNVYEHDYDDGVILIANPALRGEQIDTLEAAADRRVNRALTLRASLFRWTMRGIIQLATDTATGVPQYKNGADVSASGVELSADSTWTWGGRLRGNLTYQNARYPGGVRLANSPEVLGKLNLSSPIGGTGLRVAYEMQYSSARETLDGSSLSGYWLSNMTVIAASQVKGLDLAINIRNIFATAYTLPGSRNNWQNTLTQDGRSVQLSISYTR
jgi:outer membrane receptor protein involved in Fe transport